MDPSKGISSFFFQKGVKVCVIVKNVLNLIVADGQSSLDARQDSRGHDDDLEAKDRETISPYCASWQGSNGNQTWVPAASFSVHCVFVRTTMRVADSVGKCDEYRIMTDDLTNSILGKVRGPVHHVHIQTFKSIIIITSATSTVFLQTSLSASLAKAFLSSKKPPSVTPKACLKTN